MIPIPNSSPNSSPKTKSKHLHHFISQPIRKKETRCFFSFLYMSSNFYQSSTSTVHATYVRRYKRLSLCNPLALSSSNVVVVGCEERGGAGEPSPHPFASHLPFPSHRPRVSHPRDIPFAHRLVTSPRARAPLGVA